MKCERCAADVKFSGTHLCEDCWAIVQGEWIGNIGPTYDPGKAMQPTAMKGRPPHIELRREQMQRPQWCG